MPDAIITSTASTFGTITGTFEADQSTVIGTITGIVAGTLDGSVGVPGPAGAPGPAGEGVPANGLEGQILLKASDTSYDTVWADNYANAVKATVRNESGATMTKGTVVYISGASGNKAVVSKASASTEAGSSKTFAILEEDIPTNQNGTAITMGLLKGVDTSTFSPGANLWLSVTPGQITQTPPAAPYHAVFLGNAVRIHVNQGEIEVRIQNGLELQELHNVSITTPTNGQVLKYDATTSLWKNQTDLNSGVWGSITGTLSNQTDLQSALDAKQNVSAMSAYLTKADNLASVASTSTARSNLGLGSLDTPTFAGVNVPGSGTSVANLGATSLTINQQGSGQFTIQPSQGIVFPNGTTQVTAYPGPPGATTWGSITGTLSSQTDLQTALNAKYDASNPSGFITASALTGYATESWVTAGFYPLTGNPSGFLTSSALTPYLTIASASATYQTIAGMSSYLTTSAAASTYQTIAGMSSYLTTTAAAATYQTQAAMASYATESWVTSQGYLTDAPSDGNQYARKDGAWDIVSGGGSSYITSVTSPLSVTSGDLSIDLTGYATESWVSSQGYITSVGFYPLTQDLGYDTSSADGRLLIDGVFDPTASGFSSSRLNFGSTTPSSPLNGDLWSNGSKFRYTLGGTTYDIASESYVTTRGYITSAALSSYAPLASPALTGVPTAPTASLGTNTTQIATTAFVIANAGSPTFASIEDTLGASISNEALSPAMIPYIMAWPGYRSMNGMNATSNTGTGAGSVNRNWMRNLYIITAANSRATILSNLYGTYDSYQGMSSTTDPRIINFSKKAAMWGIVTNGHNHETINTFYGTTNSFIRANLGGRAGAVANGNITQKGIGFYLPGGGASEVQLTVHNGTTRTDVASGFTPASNSTFHYMVTSDGAGNVYLYINGTLRCQTSAGPTGTTTSNYNGYEEQVDCNASNTTRYAAQFAGTGVYIEL